MTASNSKSHFSMTTKFPKALAAAGLAAVLVGCGGGSETARMETPEDMGPTLEQKQATQRMAINEAITAFNTALGKVNNEAPDSDVTDAETALAAILTAIDAADDLPAEEVNAHRRTYSTSQSSLADRKQRRTAHMEAEAERMRMEQAAREKKARDDAAKLWVAAINSYEVGNTDGSGVEALPQGTSNLRVDYKNNVTTIVLDSDGKAIPNVDSRSPATGWTAKRFTLKKDKERGVIVTNRGAKSRTTTTQGYETYFYNGDNGAARTFSDGDLLNGVTVNGTSYVTGSGDATDSHTLTFTTSADKFRTFHFNDASPQSLSVDANKSKNITFLGVPGTLSCPDAGTNCAVTVASNGTFKFAGSPTFIPTNRNFSNIDIALISEIGNDNYATFGYWLTTTGSGNNMKHSIDTFVKVDGYEKLTSANALIHNFIGSATYSGGAGGVYVLKTGDLLDNPDLHHGEFVADVALKAQFGPGNDADITRRDQWKITGNIDDFRSLTDTDHNLSAWDLALSADFGNRVNGIVAISPDNSTFTNAKTGGGTGSWTAAFYGTGSTANSTTDPGDVIKAIAGEFDGHFTNGHVVGAFAAVKD